MFGRLTGDGDGTDIGTGTAGTNGCIIGTIGLSLCLLFVKSDSPIQFLTWVMSGLLN